MRKETGTRKATPSVYLSLTIPGLPERISRPINTLIKSEAG